MENREPTVLGELKVLSSGPVTYELLGEGADNFAISNSGEVQNKVSIDREQNAKYELIVKATDGNGKYSNPKF